MNKHYNFYNRKCSVTAKEVKGDQRRKNDMQKTKIKWKTNKSNYINNIKYE